MTNENSTEFLLYQTDDGETRLEVRLEGETVWLTQAQMAELFGTTPQNITLHVRSVYEEGELEAGATCKEYLQVRREGQREVARSLLHYNLDVIISVGYRVRSLRGTQFRIWATQRLREYIVKGFVMDDERLKRAGSTFYFEELLERIRDIRSSEKMFYQKVLDIYATSIDYDSRAEISEQFFATVQNKMHWAAHGHTAAEIVYQRADGEKPNVGMTNFSGERPRKTDVGVAKNYLTAEELDALNHIVSFYLEFAELQAKSRRPMTMHDWISKLDAFLRLSEREVLTHAGKISKNEARTKAESEFETYRHIINTPSRVEKDFEAAIQKIKELPKPKNPCEQGGKNQ